MADADAVLLPLALRRRGVGGLPSTARAHGGVTFSLEPVREEDPCHMLDACFLCRRPFGAASDVFMYMGDTAFCSKECRQEQIDMDEARASESRYRRRRHQHHLSVSVKQAPSSPQQSVYVPASDGVVAS